MLFNNKTHSLLIILFILISMSCEKSVAPKKIPINNSNEYDGNISVKIPELLEFTNIAISITDFGLNDPNYIHKEGDYYNQVQNYFLPFKEHPFISIIESMGNNIFDYNSILKNSIYFHFENDSIVLSEGYSEIELDSLTIEFMIIAGNFVKTSKFRSFYQNNLSYYEQRIQSYKEAVPAKTIWLWLEEQFPYRYDLYNIYISPLTGGSHFTTRLENNGMQELMMFVSGPEGSIYDSLEEGIFSRIVFTEIDHNYVNPTTDLYLDRVNSVFSDIKKWNDGNDYYPTPYSTFNEYMTWAVFTLYAYDRYKDDNFNLINQKTLETMTNRKFVLFEQFSDKLLELYLNKGEGEAIPDLYLGILEWAENI